MEIGVEIEAKIGKIKYFNLLVTDLKCDLENPNYLKSIMWSAYFAYFLSEDDLLRNILDSFVNICFDGNYDKWTWIEGGLVLMSQIGNEIQRKDNCRSISTKIMDVLNFGDSDIRKKINRKAFTRRMNGESLIDYCKKIQITLEKSNFELEFMYLMGYYKELLFIYVMGRSDNCSVDELSIKLSSTEEEIKSLLKS